MKKNKIKVKRISFILATRNRADFLEKRLIEIKKLLGKNDELIIIDGESTDNTKDLVKKYSGFIDIFVSEPDINQIHATNKGLLLAQGKYIKILTDDDTVFPAAMKKAIKVLEKNPKVDILICGGTWSKSSDQTLRYNYVPKGANFGQKVDDVIKYGACGMGFIIKKSALAQIGLFNINDWIADTSFIIQAIKAKSIIKFCRINLYHATAYEHSTGNRIVTGMDQAHFNLMAQYAPKKQFWRYRINHYLWLNPKTKIILFFPLFLWEIYKKNFQKKESNQNTKYSWDGGFS